MSTVGTRCSLMTGADAAQSTRKTKKKHRHNYTTPPPRASIKRQRLFQPSRRSSFWRDAQPYSPAPFPARRDVERRRGKWSSQGFPGKNKNTSAIRAGSLKLNRTKRKCLSHSPQMPTNANMQILQCLISAS